MAYTPDFTVDPDTANMYVIGVHVFHDNIVVGPADVDRLRSLSAMHAESVRLANPFTGAASALMSGWWAMATGLAANELEAGRLDTLEDTVISMAAIGLVTPPIEPEVTAEVPTKFKEAAMMRAYGASDATVARVLNVVDGE
jgi:hypothetical protein